MPENPLPESLIKPDELRELAGLFDIWTNNFHPLSPEAKDAENSFNQKASAIFEQRIKTKFRSINEQQFKAKTAHRMPPLAQEKQNLSQTFTCTCKKHPSH